MTTNRLGLGVRFYRIRFSATGSFLSYNGNRSLWPKNIFYKKSGFTDHRSPSRFIPTDRSVFKPYLQLTIIVVPFGNILRQPCPDSTNLDRFGTCHLTHNIYIMHTTIYNWTQTFHEISVHVPHCTFTLLIEIHTHDQGLT